MKIRSILAAILLIAATSARAADWVGQVDGTWNLSVTVTASTTKEKDLNELLRKDDNRVYRFDKEQLTASQWAAGNLTGLQATQKDGVAIDYVVFNWLKTRREQFKKDYVSRNKRALSVDDGDTEALAATVLQPPDAP